MSHQGHQPSNTRDINRTYVLSACKNVRSVVAHKLEPRLKLQKRATIVEESPGVEKSSEKDVIQQPEPEIRLTLQRRLRTGCVEKDDPVKNPGDCGKVKTLFGKQQVNYGLTQSNTVSNISNNRPEFRTKGLNGANWKTFQPRSLVNGLKPQNTHVSKSCEDVKVPCGRNAKGNDPSNSSGNTGQDLLKTPIAKNGGLDRQKTPKSGASGLFRSASTKEVRSPAITPKRPVNTLPTTPRRIPGTNVRPEKTGVPTIPSESLHVKDEAVSLLLDDENEHRKEENCAVTVAVRVRPFSKRFVR